MNKDNTPQFEQDYVITVSGVDNQKGEGKASGLMIYLPVTLREAANLNAGDPLEIRVVNNKIAMRYNKLGKYFIHKNGNTYIPCAEFKPPLATGPATVVKYTLKKGWLAFQLPSNLEMVEKGFHLLGSTAR